MRSCLERHPMFEALTQEELDSDPVLELLCNATEEGQKVARNGGQTFRAKLQSKQIIRASIQLLPCGVKEKE
ncbi:unnamed protein product [Brassica rapa subsp. narinosa]|uniref:(rape) hypothetical protein n=1 Tax=Brassica napus TaxID=3708 RepID=A0A816NLP6_BRANA|nr:unnamed protein product [Brassica napus]